MSCLFTSGGQSTGASISISPSNEYSGLISFRINWFDLLSAQGTLKSLLQHRSSKASILQHSTFFLVQLSHPYMTTGKTITLTIWAFVSKVMSLLYNTLSRLAILSFQRASIFEFMAVVTICSDFGALKICHCFHLSPFFCHEMMGPDLMILVFWMLSFKPAFSLSFFTFIKRLYRVVMFLFFLAEGHKITYKIGQKHHK